MIQEIFKKVKGYEGVYQISNFGRVKSLERYVKHPSGSYKIIKERILKSSPGSNGYLKVDLSLKGENKSMSVHQLVAVAFLNHKLNGHKWVVDHKDFDRLNNHLSNIKIITARENTNLKHLKSSSRYVGVGWKKQNKRWQSQIRINGRTKFLGYFINEIDAHYAYQNALKNIKIEKAS